MKAICTRNEKPTNFYQLEKNLQKSYRPMIETQKFWFQNKKYATKNERMQFW